MNDTLKTNIKIVLREKVSEPFAFLCEIFESGLPGCVYKSGDTKDKDGLRDTFYILVPTEDVNGICANLQQTSEVTSVVLCCQTCEEYRKDAVSRTDNGIACGVHCDACFIKMRNEAREQSF
ncbi:MAG: hypothetical protein PHU42_02380 [Patescibacteria group bacterium]|nr:hypothetical protein [Patescibacteria group bacterium]